MRRPLAAVLAGLLVLSFAVLPGAVTPRPAAAVAPALRVAVVKSAITEAASKVDGGTQAARADNVFRLLSAEPGLSVKEIGDTELASVAMLNAYDAVVLVRDCATTEAQRVALREFAATGGGVVSIFSTSRYDYRPGYPNPYKGTNAYGSYYWPFNYYWGFSASSYMSQAFEYGELSEMIATRFCNDPYFYPNYSLVGASPSAHPILQMTAKDLGTNSISFKDPSAQYNELVWPTKNAPITTLVSYSGETLAGGGGIESHNYGYGAGSHMAGWAMPYYYGKVVSYGFQLYDLISQRPAARLLVNSVKWAGTHDGFGPIMKTPDVSVSAWYTRGQIWCNAGVSNGGGIQLRGQLKVEFFKPGASTPFDWCYIKDPNGWIPVSPGERYTDTAQKKPSVGATPGRWIVRVSYRYFDYFHGGWVAVYRDGYLDANGSSMTWRGSSGRVGPASVRPEPAGSTELAGSDRYGTSVAVSQAGWPSGVDTTSNAVVLASAWNFTDALAAASLAGKLHAPILLTNTTSLPGSVAAELARLYQSAPADKPAKLYVVSTLQAGVVPAAQSAIANAGTGGRAVDTSIVAGADWAATARNIAEAIGPATDPSLANTAFIVTASGYADALSIAPVAARAHVPILFVGTTVPPATQEALDTLGITHSIIIGSSLAVSGSVEQWLGSNGHRATGDARLQGATRYETCLAVLGFAKAHGFSGSGLFVATGTNFPDALALAPLAAQRGDPVLLVDGNDIGFSSPSAGYLLTQRASAPSVTFVGSPLAVSTYVRGQAGVALAP